MHLLREILAAEQLAACFGAKSAAAYLRVKGWSLQSALRVCRKGK